MPLIARFGLPSRQVRFEEFGTSVSKRIEGIPDTWLETLGAKDLIDACLFYKLRLISKESRKVELVSGRNTNGDGTVSPCSNWSIVSWFEQRVFAWSDNPTPKRFATDTLIVFLTMLLATVLGAIFYDLDMEACIVITYVLAVLCVSLLTVGRLHCLVASAGAGPIPRRS